MKKFGQFIFNVFWVLTAGLSCAISSGITGIALCLTIIGIPLGLQHFKFAKLIFAPAGKTVALKYKAHPILNTLWLIFGGFELFVIYKLLSLVFYITIIGIPIARQLGKIADFYYAPFGCEIVKENEYSSTKNFDHDFNLLEKRICANPNKVMSTVIDESGVEKVVTVKQWLAEKIEADKKSNKKNKLTPLEIFEGAIGTIMALAFIGGFVGLIIWGSITFLQNAETIYWILYYILCFFPLFVFLWYIMITNPNPSIDSMSEDEQFCKLFDLYPDGSPYVVSFKGYTFLVRLGIEPFDNGYTKKYMPFTEEELKKLTRDGDK